MVSFDFYRDAYQGSTVPEKAFAGAAAKAQAVLDRLCRLCRVEGGEDSKAMAVCAMAETLYRHRFRAGGVTQAALGEASVRYAEEGPSLLGRLYEQARIYLDIYRGLQEQEG